jgi:hypothetical protein
MTPRYVSILKVLATYSAYILGIIVLIVLALRYSTVDQSIHREKMYKNFKLLDYKIPLPKDFYKSTHIISGIESGDSLNWKETMFSLKNYFVGLRHIGEEEHWRTSLMALDNPDVQEIIVRSTLILNYHPILNALAQIGMVGGVTSAVFDILGSIGFSLRGLGLLVGNFNSKVRNQVLKVLGKDTQKKIQSLRKKTIKKK